MNHAQSIDDINRVYDQWKGDTRLNLVENLTADETRKRELMTLLGAEGVLGNVSPNPNKPSLKDTTAAKILAVLNGSSALRVIMPTPIDERPV